MQHETSRAFHMNIVVRKIEVIILVEDKVVRNTIGYKFID